MYSSKPGLIIGFHGCDISVADKVICQQKTLKASNNSYDWLGHGFYFWEGSYERAFNFAKWLKKSPPKNIKPVEEPAVIGAVLDLGYCLDLLEYGNLQLLQSGYDILTSTVSKSELPINRNAGGDDMLLRDLDCAVIESLHEVREEHGKQSFDSVRAAFWEGKELYPGAGFKSKNHIQICIRNPNCIKGLFYPRRLNNKHPKV